MLEPPARQRSGSIDNLHSSMSSPQRVIHKNRNKSIYNRQIPSSSYHVLLIRRSTNAFPPALDLPHARRARNTRARRPRTRHALALEVTQEIGVAAPERTRAPKRINLARVAQTSLANGIRTRARAAEELALVLEQRGLDVLEDVSLCDDHCTRAVVEGVAGVCVEVVVDGVDERVAARLGGAARGVVDVVALEGDEVGRARQVEGPVVVAVAGGGPRGLAVELVVGDGHAVGGAVAEDDHLAADEGEFVVVCGGLALGRVWYLGGKVKTYRSRPDPCRPMQWHRRPRCTAGSAR